MARFSRRSLVTRHATESGPRIRPSSSSSLGKTVSVSRNVVSAITMQTLTDEQRAFVEAIRDFAQRECGTREQRDALTDHGREPHNDEIYARIAGLGWLGAAIPEEYGGSGGGAVDMCLLCEESARGQIPMGFFGVSMITVGAVGRFGSEELKHEILGGVAQGRVEAIAMSEPEDGSD